MVTAYKNSISGREAGLIKWTPEQRFLFDLKGWVVLPGILEEGEVKRCRSQLHRIVDEPDTLDSAFRASRSLSGPLQELVDHPVLVDVLRDIVAADVDDDSYGFRLESSFWCRRDHVTGPAHFKLHKGRGKSPGPHDYHVHHGRIYSGRTHAIWELNGVGPEGGGTQFVSGSHKAHFELPTHIYDDCSPFFETYACPPGSLVIFCERVFHTGSAWTNQDFPRMGIFNSYCHADVQGLGWALPNEALREMPPKRRTLFRGVSRPGDAVDENRISQSCNEANRCL